MELFTDIFEITIFSSVMILIVLSVKAIFGNKINAKTISFLWALVLIRLIIPITFESPVHMDSIIPVKTRRGCRRAEHRGGCGGRERFFGEQHI